MKYIALVFVSFLLFFENPSAIYTSKNGKISFTSDAPLELIEAKSEKLSGVINTDDKSFLFTIPMTSFGGFNSTLQKTHFNENYVESSKYPQAKFEGKIIEDIDFKKPGTYSVRAKGKFEIHGVQQQRIIKSKLIIKKGSIDISSDFTVMLVDHNIKIPSVVNQKLAEEIKVKVNITLMAKK